MPTESVIELEFRVSDSTFPFVEGSTLGDGCRFELQSVIPQANGEYLEFWTVTDEPPPQLEWCPDGTGVESWSLADPTETGFLVFSIANDDLNWVQTLATEGAIPRDVWSDSGAGVIVADVLPWHDAAGVVSSIEREHPSVTLAAKRKRDRPERILNDPGLAVDILDALTVRQREVLRTAYVNGYFERPRETTGRELAERLDISSATFSQHLVAALDNLLSILIEEQLMPSDPTRYDQ